MPRIKHGHCIGKPTSTYRAWTDMLHRCYRESDPRYEAYGGRGIGVCISWRESFKVFLEDMGEKPESRLSLERIDNNRDYEPSNCRWASLADQARNRRNTKLTWEQVNEIRDLIAQGELSYKQIGAQYGVHYTMIWRIKYGRSWGVDGKWSRRNGH